MSDLKKIRVQHVDRNAEGVEVKTDVDVITDADCITMDDGDLRSGVKKMIDDRIGEVIDGAPEELDTLKEIATELEKNQSGVSTILNKLKMKIEKEDLKQYAKNGYVSDLYNDLKTEIEVSVRDSYARLKKEKNTEHMDLRKDLYQELDKITELKADKTEIKTNLSEMNEDSTHRTVTDSDKTNWDSKVSRSEISDFKRCIALSEANYTALSEAEKNRADTLYFLK